MKKFLLSSLIAAAAAVPAFAGVDNINYQAVIKNGNEVVASKDVALRFELLDKSEKVVYSEIQYTKTNAAGYVSCLLGQDKDLTEIEWGDLTLSVSVDLGSGFQAISSEAVSSVPSALYSLRSADTDALTEQVDAFATMLEGRIDKIQGQADASDLAIEQLTEQIDSFATMNEARLDKMQNQMDETDKAAGENYDDLKGSVMRNEQNISALQGKVNEFQEEYQEDFQKMSEFQDGMSTSFNEFKAEYQEDFQKMSEFQDGMSTSFNEFKAEYQEDFQKMSEFQQGVSSSIDELNSAVEGLVQDNEDTQSKLNSFGADIAQIEGLAKSVEQLEDSVKMIADPQDPDSMINMMSERMAMMESELMQQIEDLQAKVTELQAEIKALKEAK